MRYCELVLVAASAFAVDCILKDPSFRLHPVRIMGYTATALNRISSPVKNRKLAGFLVYVVLSLLWLCVGVVIDRTPPPYRIMAEILIVYFMIAPNQLISEVERIHRLISRGDIEGAKKRLSLLVTRKTRNMDEEALITTSLETLAENISDCFIAPLFYFLVGGLPLLLFYKITETTDSMFGYKTENLKDFGFCFARADDLLNFLPARITVLITAISSFLWGKSFIKPIAWAKRFGPLHESPNAGFPEAAFAAVLGIRFGGKFTYFDKTIEKPFIGVKEREITPKVIEEGAKFARFFCITTIALILASGLVLK